MGGGDPPQPGSRHEVVLLEVAWDGDELRAAVVGSRGPGHALGREGPGRCLGVSDAPTSGVRGRHTTPHQRGPSCSPHGSHLTRVCLPCWEERGFTEKPGDVH